MRLRLASCLATVLAFPGPAPAQQAARPAAAAGRFEFRLRAEAVTSAGIFDAKGRMVCPLWTSKSLSGGVHSGSWHGVDQFGQPVPAAEYELRVVVGKASYENVGVIGNTGNDAASHTPGNMESVAVDAEGAVYTANGWEEEGADFKKWDRAGKSVYDAAFQIRNGDPNGAPYAIAVDGGYLYCAMGGWPRAPFNSRQQVQRFRARDGKHEPFTRVSENAGHIQVHEWPEKQVPPGTPEADAALMRAPLRALAVAGETLYVGDALGGKVHRFHKATGERLGEFAVRLPAAIAVAPDGRVWVGHEHGKVSAFDPAGKSATTMISGPGDIRALAFGPKGRLYVADRAAGQVAIYETDRGVARRAGSFGRGAEPGDPAPDHFSELQGVAADREGGLATIQTGRLGGARLARWSPAGRLLWEQLGLEFVSLGNYSRRAPDEFLSLQFNRYRLARKPAPPRWEYRGNLFAGDRRYAADVHGVPRIVRLGANDFFFTAQGDGMQVYRREGEALRPSARIGGRWPTADGRRDESGPLGQWAWHDADGDGTVGRTELNWFRRPGSGRYSVLGMNVDETGQVLYCDQEERTIRELPLTGLDARGNPVYDWARARVIVPRDRSRAKLQPIMAVRSAEGQLYAFGRSETWKEPKNLGAWMGGWALSRYDAAGALLWAVPLPEVCVGMDSVPGGGVLLGWYEKGHLFHYSADGLLIGTAAPGPAAGGSTGWLDNTAALAVNRDPRDRVIDAFTSDNFLYRILWYRIDDRAVETVKARVEF